MSLARTKSKTKEPRTKITWKEIKRQKVLLFWAAIIVAYGVIFYYLPLAGWAMAFQNYKPKLVDQIINNWLHFTKRLLVKFHRAYKSNDRLLDLHLLHQNIYKFCLQVPALY